MSKRDQDLSKNFLAENEDHQDTNAATYQNHKASSGKTKKFVIIGIIIAVILALALGLGLGLGLKSSSSGGGSLSLTVSRGFQIYDAYEYNKNSLSCVDALDFVVKNTTYCENSSALVSFHVVSITSSKDMFPNDPNQFEVYSLYVHLKNLTVSNSSDSVILGGADIQSNTQSPSQKRILFLRDRKLASNVSNSTSNGSQSVASPQVYDDFPMLKAIIFENGTIYQVFKPKNITEKEKSLLVEALKEFSPQLAKKLYNPSRKDSSLVALDNSSNQSVYYPYQEGYGSIFVDPTFVSSQENGKIYLQKLVNKSNMLNVSLPDSSDYNANVVYVLNSDSGHLEAVHSNGSTLFRQSRVNATWNDEDPNYFAGEKLQKTDYSSDNRIPNPYSRSFSANSSSLMNLSSFQRQDKDSVDNLQQVADGMNFDEVQLDNASNSSFVRRGDSGKPDNIDTYQRVTNGRRILEADVTTLDDFKNKYIVYPLSKTDFWGFELSVEMFLKWKPNSNTLGFDFYLYEERTGFFVDLCRSELSVPLAQTNKDLVNWLLHSYLQITDLSGEVKNLFDEDLFTRVTEALTKVEEAVDFPFNIPAIFEEAFKEVMPKLLAKLQSVIDAANQFIMQDADHIFANPLDSYTDSYKQTLKNDVRNFLVTFNTTTIPNFSNRLQQNLDNLKNAINNNSPLFPDVSKDLQDLKSELNARLSAMRSILPRDVQDDFENQFMSLLTNLMDNMTTSYDAYYEAIRTSGFSKGLAPGLHFVDIQSQGTVNRVKAWYDALDDSFKESISASGELQPDFALANQYCSKTADSLSSVIDDLTNLANQKTSMQDDIKPYEDQASKWNTIMANFQDFRYQRFDQLFDYPMILNDTIQDSLFFLNNFYNNYSQIEKRIGNFSSNLRTRIDELIYYGTERVKDYDLQIRYLLAEDTSEIKVLYTSLLQSALDPVSYNLSVLLNDTLNTMDTVWSDILKAANQTQQAQGGKAIFCTEESEYQYTISGKFNSSAILLEGQIADSIASYLQAIQGRIITSLRIPDFYNVSNVFYNLTQIQLGDDDLFNADKIQSDFVDHLVQLFNDTKQDVLRGFTQNVTAIMDEFKGDLNQKILTNLNVNLPQYADTYSCTGTIYSTNSNPNAFCVIYSLTLQEINEARLSNPNPTFTRQCALFDEATDLVNALLQRIVFYPPVDSPKIDVLVNAELKKFTNQSTSAISDIDNATELLLAVSVENFRELEDRLEDIRDNDKNAWDSYFLDKANDIVQYLENNGNNIIDQLRKHYTDIIQQISDFVDSNSEIKDFVVSDLSTMLSLIRGDGNYLANYINNQSEWSLAGSLYRLFMIQQKNNEILVNYYNYTYVNYLIPKSMANPYLKYLVDHQSLLEVVYKHRKDMINAVVDTGLTIRTQDFTEDFDDLMTNLNVIYNNAAAKREVVSTNNTKSFQLNAFEDVDQAESLNNLAQVPLVNFDDSVIQNAEDIANIYIDESFKLLQNRFDDFHSILNNSDRILNNLTRDEVQRLLNETLDNIFYFFSSDNLIQAKFQELAKDFNSVAKVGLLSFATEFENDIENWQEVTYNTTMDMLKLDEYCVNDNILQQYEHFQQYILARLTRVYTTNLPDLQQIFFHILSELKILVKGTIYNATMDSMFNLTNGIPTTLSTLNGETISLLDLINQFKDDYKLRMNDAINYALENIYDDAAPWLEELTAILENVYSTTENELLTVLTNISERMIISNEHYDSDRLGIDFGNITIIVPSQDGHFAINYFDFLTNQTNKYNDIIDLLDLSNLTQLEKFRNLKRYLDVDFQISVMDSNLQMTNIKLVEKVADYKEIASRLNYEWEAEMLGVIFIQGMESLKVPLRQIVVCQQSIQNMNATNVLLNADLTSYVQSEFVWLANYLNDLSSRTSGSSSVEILIQMENARVLYINGLSQIFTSKVQIFSDELKKQLDDLVDNVQANFVQRLDGLELNDYDNDLEKKALEEKILEIKEDSPILNWKNQDTSDLANEIINPLTIVISSSTASMLTAINNAWDYTYSLLQEELSSSAMASYSSKKELYSYLLQSIQLVRSFAPLDFNISNYFSTNITAVQVNFNATAEKVVEEFQAIIETLPIIVNDSLNNLTDLIKNQKLQPILENVVFPPIVDLKPKLANISSDLLDQIITVIDQKMNTDSSNSSSRILAHVEDTTITITGLQEVMNLFTHSLEDSIDLINNLPIVHDIERVIKEFAASLDQNDFLVSEFLDDNLYNFTLLMDTKELDSFRTSILTRLTTIDNFARNVISVCYQNISKAVESFRNVDWKVIETHLVDVLNRNRETITQQVMNNVLPQLTPSQFGGCELVQDFDIQLPIPGWGIFDFGFGITGDIDWRLDMGVDNCSEIIYVDFYPSVVVILDGHARLDLIIVEWDAFIRGTLVNAMLTFKAEYHLNEVRCYQTLCLNMDFGALQVGISSRSVVCRRSRCWFGKCWCIHEWTDWEMNYLAPINPLPGYFGCLNLEEQTSS